MPPTPIARRVALLLLPVVGLATILGGSVFWLRRVGWLQAERYWYSVEELTLRAPHPENPQALYDYVMLHHGSLHQLDGWLMATKYAREAVLAAFILLALTQLHRVRSSGPSIVAAIGMFILATASALAAAVSGQWFALAAGVRSLGAWFIGTAGAPLVDESFRRRLARVCAWTVLAEAVLCAIEFRRGLLVYDFAFFDHQFVRVVGSFNLPASLGTFVVVAWALTWCWSGYPRRVLQGLTVLVLALLTVNASATSWVAFATVGFVLGYSRLRARWRPWLLAASLPLALLGWQALPGLTGRSDVHDSLWGRIAPIPLYAEGHLSTREILLGTGMGLGTNALGSRLEVKQFVSRFPDHPTGDSTPAVLFWQVGLLGMLFAYALFAIGIHADPGSRAIGVALLVSSVAVNITELFPVNLILGFWLAHACFSRRTNVPA